MSGIASKMATVPGSASSTESFSLRKSIIDEVDLLVSAGTLDSSDGDKLKSDLEKAIKEFDKLHVHHGIDDLEKFIKEAQNRSMTETCPPQKARR